MDRMRIRLLGVPIDALRRDEALDRVRIFFDGGSHLIATPNPEMLVMAHKDAGFREALGSADLALADGFGLVLMARLRGQRIPERITGVDFLTDIAGLCAAREKRVFLLGAGEGVARAAAEALGKRFPALIIAGAASGGTLRQDNEGVYHIDDKTMGDLKVASPDVLFVAFGHGKQELWITQHLPELPSVRVAMGVGGAFDFIAGKIVRAPKAMRAVGLEWLWRLIREPRRLGRIWTAVAVFPWLVLREKR